MAMRPVCLTLLVLLSVMATRCAPGAPTLPAAPPSAAPTDAPRGVAPTGVPRTVTPPTALPATAAPPTVVPPPTAAPPPPTAAPTTAPAAKTGEGPRGPAPGPIGGGGLLNIHWRTSAPVSLNPLFSPTDSEQQAERLIFGALLRLNDRREPTPDLAEGWEVAPDARTYTFHLRRNIRFSDGQPLTAADVVFTFERALDRRTGSVWGGRLANIDGATDYADQKAATIRGLETPDPYTVRVRLIQPDAALLTTRDSLVGLAILPKHILHNVAPDQLRTHPFSTQAPTVSAGAYSVANVQPGQFIELRRNERYFAPPPAVERIVLRIVPDALALTQLQAGQLDLMLVPVVALDRARALPNVTVLGVANPATGQPSYYAIAKRLQGFKPPADSDNFLWNAEAWTIGG